MLPHTHHAASTLEFGRSPRKESGVVSQRADNPCRRCRLAVVVSSNGDCSPAPAATSRADGVPPHARGAKSGRILRSQTEREAPPHAGVLGCPVGRGTVAACRKNVRARPAAGSERHATWAGSHCVASDTVMRRGGGWPNAETRSRRRPPARRASESDGAKRTREAERRCSCAYASRATGSGSVTVARVESRTDSVSARFGRSDAESGLADRRPRTTDVADRSRDKMISPAPALARVVSGSADRWGGGWRSCSGRMEWNGMERCGVVVALGSLVRRRHVRRHPPRDDRRASRTR
jgi:hypothetical protein